MTEYRLADAGSVALMSAICGVVAWKPGSLVANMRAEVGAVLLPHGTPTSWSGRAGALDVDVSVHGMGESAARSVARSEALVLCLDAHLHRRRELAGRLGKPSSATEAELVLAGYERWGQAVVDHLSGSFALALVDRQRGGLLLARDHAGTRPLAVHQRDGLLAFATTALALSALPGVGPELDLERAREVILLAYGTNRTFVRGVRLVPPGTALWVDHDGIRTWRWWLPQELPARDAGSLHAHASELREALEDAVASTLDGAASVGAMLSGGLDSASVAAVAASQLAPRTLTSFTSIPPRGWTGTTMKGWIPDERFAVEALAGRTPNLRSQFVEVPAGSLFEHDVALWELGSGPARNSLNLIWIFACYQRAAAAGLDVLLTGSAGNLAFSADGPLWLAALVRRGRLVKAAGEARQFATAFDVGLPKVLRRDLLARLLPDLKRRRMARHGVDPVQAWIGASAIRREHLAEVDVARLLPELVHPHPGGFTRDTGRMFLGAAAQADLYSAVRARWGIELRDPTADRHLVELAVTQPEWWRRHKGEWRAIPRAAMRDVLPTEIVDRPTLGAQQPDWLDRLTAARHEILAELEEMRDHHASYDLIDVERLDALVADWPDRSRMTDPRVVREYQLALGRAMSLSRYLRWFEGRAKRVRSGGPAVLPTATS